MKRIILLFSLFYSVCSFGQFNYLAANAVNTTGTYTDLGTNGTAITTNSTAGAMTFDDDNSSVQNIGFNFSYNGTTFTQFVLNTNGFIKLGATATASAAIYDPNASTETNLISALARDLDGGTAPEYRVYTSGAVGSRVCTIQYKNLVDYPTTYAGPVTDPVQFTSVNFQIKLYETTNNVEIAYGSFAATTNTSTAILTVAGVKGSSAASSVNATKASSQTWSAATFINGDYPGNKFNVRNTVLPVSGSIFRFVAVALVANDAQVVSVQTLSKLPLVYGSPHTVKAVVKNAGSTTLTNLIVTLSVSGANTFTTTQTIPSLAIGASATVAFAGFTPSANGTNTVAVTVPSDGDNTNNAVSTTQLVNNIAFSYADNSAATGAIGFNTGSGILANKYTIQGTAYITNVKVFIASNTPTVGNSVSAVVLNAAGTIVGQSASYVVLASDLSTYKNFSITTPPSVSSGDFYVGLAQTANAIGYFPVGSQTETPTRAGAYYSAPLAGGAAPTENATVGRLMIEAVVSSTATPTPLTLLSFNGKLVGSSTQLNWTTATEVNTDKFEIERTSSTSVNWIKIATLGAAGNSFMAKTYQLMDANLTIGKWLYRLKMIDKDGSYTYSGIVSLDLSGKAAFVLNQNYPNPVKGSTQLSYQINTDAKITIEFLTNDGRRIATLVNQQQAIGSYNITVDLSKYGLAAGNYLYRMIALGNDNETVFQATRTITVVQ